MIWVRLFCLLFISVLPVVAAADGAGERETLALKACLSDYADAERQCFDVPYYTCMGEQLTVAANPELAQERCLFQEMFVWGDILEETCEALASIFERGTSRWEALCFANNSPNWGYLTQELVQPEWDRGFPNYSLQLSVESVRAHAVQLRMLLAAFRDSKTREN